MEVFDTGVVLADDDAGKPGRRFRSAERSPGGRTIGTYRLGHAPAGADVLRTAGAGGEL